MAADKPQARELEDVRTEELAGGHDHEVRREALQQFLPLRRIQRVDVDDFDVLRERGPCGRRTRLELLPEALIAAPEKQEIVNLEGQLVENAADSMARHAPPEHSELAAERHRTLEDHRGYFAAVDEPLR